MSRNLYATKPGLGKFGARLKAERMRRGFKLMDFAAEVGISVSQITAAENRGVIPHFLTVIAMAQALDCSIDWLAGVDD